MKAAPHPLRSLGEAREVSVTDAKRKLTNDAEGDHPGSFVFVCALLVSQRQRATYSSSPLSSCPLAIAGAGSVTTGISLSATFLPSSTPH